MRRPIIDAFERLLRTVCWGNIVSLNVDALTECIHIMTTTPGDYFRIKYIDAPIPHFELAQFDDIMIPVIVEEDDWELVKKASSVDELLSDEKWRAYF